MRISPLAMLLAVTFDADRPPGTEPEPVQPKPAPIPPPHIPEAGFERLKRHPLRVACPKCKRPPGKRCNPTTLGRHKFHGARIKALQTILVEESTGLGMPWEQP